MEGKRENDTTGANLERKDETRCGHVMGHDIGTRRKGSPLECARVFARVGKVGKLKYLHQTIF